MSGRGWASEWEGLWEFQWYDCSNKQAGQHFLFLEYIRIARGSDFINPIIYDTYRSAFTTDVSMSFKETS